jgi:hypothetical protein
MKPIGYLNWDIKHLSKSMKISESEVIEYFQDGRRGSFLMERSLRNELNLTLAPSEGSSYDLIDQSNLKWEVRSLTNKIYFSNSSNVGSGRKFNEKDFLKKIKEIAGYYITDLFEFPIVPYYKIKSEIVERWYLNNKDKKSFAKGEVKQTTDAKANIPRAKMLRLIQEVL